MNIDKRTPLKTMTLNILADFSSAWTNRDVERLMSHMSADPVYSASVGDEPGQTYRGRDEVRRGFGVLLAFDLAGDRREGEVRIDGSRGFAQWSYIKLGADGVIHEIRGCDLFEFEGDKIKRKDAFRKAFPG
jgi:hypothetical protein